MKLIYEHDEEEDFIEIHLTQREVNHILRDEVLAKDFPAGIHSRRFTNICIRKTYDAIETG